MSLLSDLELEAIQQRCDATTPGPWKSMFEGRDHTCGDSFILTGGEDFYLTGATIADQDFIASARQDIPKLLEEIRLLREKVSK